MAKRPAPRELDNPADAMRNLLKGLNARYLLVMSEDGALAARPYASLARAFAKACEQWADICEGKTLTCCNRCDRQRYCTTLDNGAVLCDSCLAHQSRLW